MMVDMARIGLLLFLIEVALAAAALISCLSAEEGNIRAIPRWAWIIMILLFPLLGGIAWFAVGRIEVPTRAPRPAPRRSTAPDDDPEFLRSLKPRRDPDDTPPKP